MMLDANVAPASMALCQYDETLLLRLHPKIASRGQFVENSFYTGPRDDFAKLPLVSVAELTDVETVSARGAGKLPRLRLLLFLRGSGFAFAVAVGNLVRLFALPF